VSQASQRRNPLRLIVTKETQLRILWLVWGAVFVCMGLAAVMVNFNLEWMWIAVVLVSVGTFVSIWVSRKIAGPLYRIEKDLEDLLENASGGVRVQLRKGDHLSHLAGLVNQLIERAERK
jgi:membrane protein implicated in regulation of membrane protease activity